MSRDYKHTNKSGGVGAKLSGTAGFFAGLAVGLGVAVAVYLHSRKPEFELPSKPIADKQAMPRSARDNGVEIGEDTGSKKYDFYDMLPKFEVVVPERDKTNPNGPAPAQIDKPGSYILQAGSYRNFADADRMRAKLALQGVESKIQKVTVDSDTWHRIRIGPTEDLAELNRTRALLRQVNIEAMVIRVAE